MALAKDLTQNGFLMTLDFRSFGDNDLTFGIDNVLGNDVADET